MKSEFSKNLITMITGTTIAQLFPLLLLPVLARIYSVQEHGTFTLFFSILGALSILSTLRFELAIVIPKERDEAKQILKLSSVVSFIISILFFLITFFFNEKILKIFNADGDIGFWLYFIPVSLFLNGLIQSQSYWLNRENKYFQLTISKIILSSISVLIPLFLSFYEIFNGILIISYLSAQLLCFLFLLYKTDFILVEFFYIKEIKESAIKYKNFPLLNAPSSVIDQLAATIPLFFINKFLGLSVAAYYGMAQKVVSVPSTFLSYSISQTLFNEVITKINNKESYYNLVKKGFINLFLIGLIPTITLLFFGETLFTVFLGQNWKMSGVFVKIIAISAFIKFIISPLSITLIASKKLKTIAIWQVTYLISNILVILLLDKKYDIFQYLVYLVVCDVLIYLFYGYLILKHSKKNI